MSYRIEQDSGDIIIEGFNKGIGDNPYSGLFDVKSVNPDSISGEASVAFSTATVMQTKQYSGISGSADGTGNILVTGLTQGKLMEVGEAINFNTSSITGATVGTLYYIAGASQQSSTSEIISITPSYGTTASITVGTTGTVTISTINMGLPKYFTKSRGNNFMIDANGRVWSDIVLTSGGSGFSSTTSWTYTGNTVDASSNGNGIVCYQTVTNGSGGTGTSAGVDEWIFVFRNSGIDYTQITSNGAATSPLISWIYGWKPSTGTTGTSFGTSYLQTNGSVNNSHQALVTPDSRVNYCDANTIGNFYQTPPSPGSSYTGFDPKNTATYTFSSFNILPFNDTAQCIGFLNAQLLIGGKLNIVYPWDLVDNAYSTPIIQLPESNIQCIITVGNNGYIFAGNRGWIYITNGSQASPWKKVPDHISGAVEPLITWGGSSAAGAPTGTATFNKDRLYFGCFATLQNGGNATGYGGVWCVDLNTGSMWNNNQLSYGTYSGYVSALGVPSNGTAAGNSYGSSIGSGIIAGWSDDAIPTFGVDVSIRQPYNGGQSYVISDMIPIGTSIEPTTAQQVEYKLSTPLLSTESVEIQIAPYLGASFTSAGITSGSSTATIISDIFNMPVERLQWVLVKAILTSRNTNPSYTRLTQMRIKGGKIK